MPRLAVIGVLALVVAAPAAAEEPPLTGTAWLIESVGGIPAVAIARGTLAINAAGEVGGVATCNRFFGGARLGEGTLQFGEMATTKVMCAAPAMDQENRFLAALRATRTYAIADNRLRLIGEDGTELAVLVGEAPPAE